MILPSLFNEELGAVIQVRHKDKGKVKDILAEYGLASCAHTIGKLAEGQRVSFQF